MTTDNELLRYINIKFEQAQGHGFLVPSIQKIFSMATNEVG